MNPKVDEYIVSLDKKWQQDIVRELRELVHQAGPEIIETTKWGTPTFEHSGIVAWLFCAKDWVHFSFPQGALLDSSHNLFEPTDNKAQRTMKFKEQVKIPSTIIIQLVKQAVKNNISGTRINFSAVPRQAVILPDDLTSEIKAYGLYKAYGERHTTSRRATYNRPLS